MAASSPQEVTRLLDAYRAGDTEALQQLFPLVYDELRRLARSQRRRNPSSPTLNTTALVHEAYLRLVGQSDGWEGRRHFFRFAARVMRHILIDYARAQRAAKRGGDAATVSLDAAGPVILDEETAAEVLDVHDALERLSAIDARMADVVELRYFGGYTIDETAAALDLSVSTIKREWATARAWLRAELDRF